MQATKNTDAGEYVSPRSAAKRIGVSERLFWNLLKDKADPIPCFRIGRKIVRIRIADLDAWMSRRRSGHESSEADRIVGELLG